MVEKFQRNRDFATANLGAELAVLDLNQDRYLGFNTTATHVWRLLESPHSLDEICAAMTAEFAVDDATCRREVESLLDRLVQAGAVRTDHGAVA